MARYRRRALKIPKYWAKREQAVTAQDGKNLLLATWQWSDESLAEAQQRADTRLLDLVLKVAAGDELNRYGYGERPLREEITQPIAGSSGGEIAVVTRNLYGALVLNAQNVMFVDIDFPANRGGGASSVKRLFGAKPQPGIQDQTVQQVEAWTASRPELGLRIYRTFGGLRCLLTNQLFDPRGTETTSLLTSLGSDPLYMRLCKAQECFRARLTPKPWRCDSGTPPSSFPWPDANAEHAFRAWQHAYEQASARFAVCQFIKQIGPLAVHPDIAPVLKLHDDTTGATSGLPLA